MKKSLVATAVLSLGLLSSCSLFDAEERDCTPEYLRPDSPLDPPGTAEARAALRAKLVKEGKFAPGEQVDIQQGKVYLFYRNPDHSHDSDGRMVEAANARIISCEGLYYFVEAEGGKKGYLRESDLVSPVTTLVATDGALFPGGELPPIPENWGELPEGAAAQNNVQRVMTNASGRTVVVVRKQSDRGKEFEERRRQLEQAEGRPTATDASAPLPDPASEALPEPAGGGDF